MPTVLELRKQKADKVAAAKAALDDAPKYAEIKGEIDALDAAIKDGVAAELAAEQRRAEVDAWNKDLLAHQPRRAAANPITQLNAEPAIPKNHNDKPFRTLGEQLMAVVSAESKTPSEEALNRLQAVYSLAPSGASVANPSDGGFLVQIDFSSEIMKRSYEMGQVLSRVRKIPISSNSNSIRIPCIAETSRANGSRWGGVLSYWGGEADTATAKKPAIRQVEIGLGKLLGLFYATDELLQDAAAMESIAMTAFQEEFQFTVEDSIFTGDGTGKPLGILNANATVSVSKETGQAAATIVFENIQKMYARQWNASNSVWFVNRDCFPQLNMMMMVVGTGGVPVYLPPGGVAASPYGTLMGRPVVPVEYCKTVGTVGDIIFADMSQYILVDKGGVKADSSMHVKFLTDEMTFRFTYRVGGQPWWSAALTPKNGSNTLSPFITLATRS